MVHQDSIEVEAAKHYNKERRQSSFCLAKVPLIQKTFSDRKSQNPILKLGNQFSFLQLAPAPPDLVEGSYKLIQVT